jgi:uncharacterized protein YecE (DUF72 family)
MRRGRAWVGCSGWQSQHWRGDFYPADLPVSKWFDYYAQRFDTVEVNNTFYRLPERATFAAWRRRAPQRFIFAVKASRFLTHMKKLRDPEEPIVRLFMRLRGLGKHLGPVLYQLPSGWRVNADRFAHFLDALPPRIRHVVEFRDPSWNSAPIRSLLDRYRVSMCLHDMPGSATGKDRVGPIVYVRFHGATGRYEGGYSIERLRSWATWLNAQRAAGCDVYAYFNNDVGGHAPRDAVALRRALQEVAPP